MIELTGISKTYHMGEVSVPVLHGVDLTIDAGEHVAIVGRSGSGKSTLMNILGCLDQPSTGSYQLDGREVDTLDDDELSDLRGRMVGFVFQSFHLLRNLTVLQNVALPMEYQGVATPERHARAKELLERVGLGHRFDHRPNQLSGGERQRVAIARALSNQPSLLLADEPTGNLDSKAREATLGLFDELHKQTGVTLVVVTHDDSIAERTPRVIRIADGRIQ
ncbi:MAG: ABC transporter ATP-binding protein [Myxococcales bacterium]|nr:ABC transporter ATP-binding protein [Myxococcales bacterium]